MSIAYFNFSLFIKTVNESVSQRVNMVNEDGVTCLHVASLHGYDRIVFLLLKHGGASPSSRTKKSLKTPLHLACQYNHVEVRTSSIVYPKFV